MLSQNTLIYENKGHNKSLRDQYIFITLTFLPKKSINLIEIFVYNAYLSALFSLAVSFSLYSFLLNILASYCIHFHP